jgi:hypothetical protein
MAEHKLEATRLLDLLDDQNGILDDFLDDLPAYLRPAMEWSGFIRRKVCPVCGHPIAGGQGATLSPCGVVVVVHRGDCCRVADTLARGYRGNPTGRWRTPAEWRRLIDTIHYAGLARPLLSSGPAGGETDRDNLFDREEV